MKTIKSGREFTGYLMFRDKRCKSAVRVFIGEKNIGAYYNFNRVSEIAPCNEKWAGRFWAGDIPAQPTCPGCNGTWALSQGTPVYGRMVEELICGSKCMGAVGPSCDCSCGGANHGGKHQAA